MQQRLSSFPGPPAFAVPSLFVLLAQTGKTCQAKALPGSTPPKNSFYFALQGPFILQDD